MSGHTGDDRRDRPTGSQVTGRADGRADPRGDRTRGADGGRSPGRSSRGAEPGPGSRERGSRRERGRGDHPAGGDGANGSGHPVGAGGREKRGDSARQRETGQPRGQRDGQRPRRGQRTPILALDGVVKRYRTGEKVLTALEGVDFRVEPGEFVTIMGPSGSGKTTMLNILGLLDRPSEGQVYFMGHDVTDFTDEQRTKQRRQTIGFVFQDFYLLESLTARENVEVPAIFSTANKEGASERAEKLLSLVGLGDRLDHYPNELSGGQQQRVAIARSLINDPKVVLADEPTGNLDEDTSTQILDLMGRICNTGASVVAVTHDPLVADYAERRVDVTDGNVTARRHR